MRRLLCGLLLMGFVASCGGEPERVVKPQATYDAAIAEREGKPIVVNFWATWCGPCKKEMPRIVAASERYEGRVHFLGIDVQDDPTAARDFIKRYEMTFDIIEDRRREITDAQGLLGLPVTLFYDAEGELAFSHNGEIDTEELRGKIEDVLDAS